jgi:hypothetical protein
MAHSDSTLTVELEDFLDENPDNESWGFRDFRVFLHTCGDESAGCKEVTRELFAPALTSDDIKGWTLVGKPEEYKDVSICHDQTLVGGYDKLSTGKLTKTFTNLPPHSTLIFNFKLFQIDSWDEPMNIVIDGQEALQIRKLYLTTDNICGGVWAD